MVLKTNHTITIPKEGLIVSTVDDLASFETGSLFLRDNDNYVFMLIRLEKRLLNDNPALQSSITKPLEIRLLRFTGSGGFNDCLFKPELILPLRVAPYGTSILINQK